MTLDTLREAFVARLADDTTFKALTGADANDGRLYAKDQADAVISETQPAYVTYLLLPHGETNTGLAQPTFSLIIWSKRGEVSGGVNVGYPAVKAVAAQVKTLFDKVTWTASSARLRSRLVRESDTEDVEYGFVGRMMQVRVGALDL